MKTYRYDPLTKTITVVCGNGVPVQLLHDYRHSSHYGSGDTMSRSAETALSIMLDYFQYKREGGVMGRAWTWHGRFMREVIAELPPMMKWQITTDEIDARMSAWREAQRAARLGSVAP